MSSQINSSTPQSLNLGTYTRQNVTNLDLDCRGREAFDQGLRLMLAYQHEEAAAHFLISLEFSPNCALAHGMVALCHCPNYNFKGEMFYATTHHPGKMDMFPSQQVAELHSRLAIEKIEELRSLNLSSGNDAPVSVADESEKDCAAAATVSDLLEADLPAPVSVSQLVGAGQKEKPRADAASNTVPTESTKATVAVRQSPQMIDEIEVYFLRAIRNLCAQPGINPINAEQIVGRPYSDAMRQLYTFYPHDPEITYFFVESLMVLNAWKLYEYPTGRALSDEVPEIRSVLELALEKHHHAGLHHMYVHLCEMSSDPSKALDSCLFLKREYPDAGHLLHMPTHIDVLLGDYESCVFWSIAAISADTKAMQVYPRTAGRTSFYFAYTAHNFHMLVYGAILGGMEKKGMEYATLLNEHVTEEFFEDNPEVVMYLESYSALDIHVLVRFGRWDRILKLAPPKNVSLMLYRAATLRYARALALANTGDIEGAKTEEALYNEIRSDPSAPNRILHNNSVNVLLAVDALMIAGEIAYREGKYDSAFVLLRQAVALRDALCYDEPWGKMQPIRHALGGLLLERGHFEEAEEVFRTDLRFHPNNPWSLTGLLDCLKLRLRRFNLECDNDVTDALTNDQQRGMDEEISMLSAQLARQRTGKWIDFHIKKACACCTCDSVEKHTVKID